MENFHNKVRRLVSERKVLISEHGYDELVDDGLGAREIVGAVEESILLEEYPNFAKGPCALFLQYDAGGTPVHVVWGIPKGYVSPS